MIWFIRQYSTLPGSANWHRRHRKALAEAEIRLPRDVLAALERAAGSMRDETSHDHEPSLQCLENIALAEERQVPICQD